jgi:hypothetical protein
MAPKVLQRGQSSTCTKCGYVGTNFHPSYGNNCRPCLAEYVRDYRRRQKSNPAWQRTQRRYSMRHRYGIEPEEYEALRIAQDGRCAVCDIPSTDLIGTPRHRSLHIDHDHASGAIRGLLCNGCNRAIGYISNDPRVAAAMAEYLSRQPVKIENLVIQERARRAAETSGQPPSTG